MGRLLLVTGGARGGKSSFALERARASGDSVLFIATGVATDAEMADRIARHRAQRPPTWTTLEARYDLAPALRAAWRGQQCVLVDDLGTLVGNLLIERSAGEAQVQAELEGLLEARAAGPYDLVVVTQEVGLGLVPPTELGRQFRDLLGLANRALAAAADEVVLLVAGIPLPLKGSSKSNVPRPSGSPPAPQ